jgi:putative ABC transport system permease protein
VAIGATTLFALATIATDIPRQMAREMRAYGANLLVMPARGEEYVPAQAKAAVDAVAGGAELIGAAPYRYQTLRLNAGPYLAAGTDLEAARTVSPYWYVDGQWPAAPGEILLGQDIVDWVGLEIGDQVELVAAAPTAPPAADQPDRPEGPQTPDQGGTGQDSGAGGHAGHSAAAATGEEADKPTDPDSPDDPEGAEGLEGEADDELVEDRSGTFTLTGVLSTGGSEDSTIMMSLADLEQLAGISGQLDVIEYSIAAEGKAIEALAEKITAEVPSVAAAPVKRLTQSDTYVLEMLRSLLGLIAVIVLALTMIGVSTTMIAVVAERRTEIALRKALGASSRSVEREFLSEGLVLGALGGLVGVALGFAIAQLVSLNVFHRGVGFNWWLAAVTVAASTVVAWVACLLPVRRAAEIDPALVLREE